MGGTNLPPPPPPLPNTHTLLYKRIENSATLRGYIFVSFHQITFKLRNFTDIKALFPAVLTDFCLLVPVIPCEERVLSCVAFTRQTTHANDFVNAKSHAREKPLLAQTTSSPPFVLRDSRASETRARVKIVSPFSRVVIFTRSRVSLALLSLRKNGELLVVYCSQGTQSKVEKHKTWKGLI